MTPSYLLITLQRAYEEAYQASVRAIVLETRNQPGDALAAWKGTLRTISTNMATVTETPKSTQEIDLMTNIMNIEKQCHDRISFLERGWPDTNPYASYSLLDSDEYIATNSRSKHSVARASTTNVDQRANPATSARSSVSSTSSSNTNSSSSYHSLASSHNRQPVVSNPSFAPAAPQQSTITNAAASARPNLDYSSSSSSSRSSNPFSTTAPIHSPVPSSANHTKSYSNTNSADYFFSDFSSAQDIHDNRTPKASSSNNKKPPPIPPKISLDFSGSQPSTVSHASTSVYQSTLDPGRRSPFLIDLSSSSSTTTLPGTIPTASTSVADSTATLTGIVPAASTSLPRASPRRKPVDSSENLLDMSSSVSKGQHFSASTSTSSAGSLPTSRNNSTSVSNAKIVHPKPVQASSTPILAQHTRTVTPPKAASTSSLTSSARSISPPDLSPVDQQFASLGLDLRRSPSPCSNPQQTPASRTMLKTLRNHQKVPKKLLDERKAASAHAASLAWGPQRQERAQSQQISLMAANLSSTHARHQQQQHFAYMRSLSQPSVGSSAASSAQPAKALYQKPTVFKAPVIHAPVKKNTHQRTQSASQIKAAPAPRRGPKFIVEKKAQSTTTVNTKTTATPVSAKPRVQSTSSATSMPRQSSSSSSTNGSNSNSVSKSNSLTAASRIRPSTPESIERSDSGSASASENPECDLDDSIDEEEAWLNKARDIVSKVKGIDQNAADQIFNDVVVKGDHVVWGDIAGLEKAKGSLKEAVVYPFLRPDLFSGLREPAQGMLLFGPPGTGKTMIARAVATESKSTFFSISASSLTSKFLGESEKLVRALFLMAKALAPSIIFVDEIDSLLSARSDSGEHESSRRIKTEFLIQWSALQHAAAGKEHDDVTRVLVLAATNLPWVIDEAARRRFVRRQYIPLPEPETRRHHFGKLLSRQKHSLTEEEMDMLVGLTDGFSGSDITALAKDAAMGPLRALGEALLTTPQDQIRPLGFVDFKASLETVRPSVSKESLKVFEDWADMYGSSGA